MMQTQFVARKSRLPALLALPLLLLTTLLLVGCVPGAQAKQSLTKETSVTHTLENLEDSASDWGIFQDQGMVNGTLANVSTPSLDGTALQIALLGGQPYAGLHAYRNLAPADAAITFEMTLSFYFTALPVTQALEFTMNKWVGNQRWEWAMQWEHTGSGGPQQGNPPTWRLWMGSSWQDTGIRQQLSANTWHHLHLSGKIADGKVRYLGFACDDTSASLSQTFAPVASPGDKLAVAVQLDGNSNEDPYQVYLDQVTLRWS